MTCEGQRWFVRTGWAGDIAYSRADVPGAGTSTGWSLTFFE